VTFAFNTAGGGAVTQNGGNGAGQAGQAGGAPNSLIGGGVSAPVTASANSGPAGIGVTFAFNTAGGGAVTQNGADGAGQAGASPAATGGGSTPTAVADPPSRLSATQRPFSAAPAPALAAAEVGRRQRPAVTAVPRGSWATAIAPALAAAPSQIHRGTGLAADGKGGRGSEGGFFSPGGNGGNATSGDGNNQRPGEGGAGGNGGSPDDAGDPGKSGGDA